MKRAVVICTFCVAIAICGCGAGSDATMKARIKAMEDLGELFKAKSKDSSKIDDALKRMKDADIALDKCSKEELKDTFGRNQDQFYEAAKKVSGHAGAAGHQDLVDQCIRPVWQAKAASD